MRALVVGSEDWLGRGNYRVVEREIDWLDRLSWEANDELQIILGGGIDHMVEEIAKSKNITLLRKHDAPSRGLDKDGKPVPGDVWTYEPDYVVAFRVGPAPEVMKAVTEAKKRGIPVELFNEDGDIDWYGKRNDDAIHFRMNVTHLINPQANPWAMFTFAEAVKIANLFDDPEALRDMVQATEWGIKDNQLRWRLASNRLHEMTPGTHEYCVQMDQMCQAMGEISRLKERLVVYNHRLKHWDEAIPVAEDLHVFPNDVEIDKLVADLEESQRELVESLP